MSLSKLNNLYRQVILDHAQHPKHHGTLASSTNYSEMRNPTCGDVMKIQLQIEDNTIKDIAFSGSGCTISQASASMMADAVIGKSTTEADQMIQSFSDLITDENEVDQNAREQLSDAAILEDVKQFPARIKCATLAWKSLHLALENTEATND